MSEIAAAAILAAALLKEKKIDPEKLVNETLNIYKQIHQRVRGNGHQPPQNKS